MEEIVKFYVANSFARTGWGGNPAGVVAGYPHLDADVMQYIARQLNLVETVFASWQENSREVQLRYFTPEKELAMAGHPTIAAFITLIQKYFREPVEGEYTIITKGGRQPVGVIKTGTGYAVRMEQKAARFVNEEKNARKVAATLGIQVQDINDDLPIEAVDTGLGHLIVPVTSLEALNRIERRVAELAELCRENGIREVQAYTFLEPNKVYTRNICPKQGLEDPACGMGNGALGAYLLKNYYKNADNITLEALQGDIVSLPSEITILAERRNEGAIVPSVQGSARLVIEGSMNVAKM
ncbi:MAG: hypothetical protein H6Q67_1290 [Firmicutes bacterium]|nr:hypothetical protein [Bacillota bacterium]